MMPGPLAAGLVPLVLALALAGCGGGHDATAKELEEMRASLSKIRADQAVLAERLDALQTSRTTPRAASSTERPALDVVHLAPTPGDETGDAEGSRPLIRATGAGGSVKSAPSEAQGPDKEYEVAMELYKARKTDKAILAFSSFLARYPDHPGAESATFLRGEAYGAKGDQRRAIEQYESVVSHWPSSAHAPEALLRVAQSYARLGDKNEADDAKKRLIAGYPASEAAKKVDSPIWKKP